MCIFFPPSSTAQCQSQTRLFPLKQYCHGLCLSDHPALAQALAAMTTPGLGKAVTYYVQPDEAHYVHLSAGRPTAAEVRAGWVPDPLAMRFRNLARALL